MLKKSCEFTAQTDTERTREREREREGGGGQTDRQTESERQRLPSSKFCICHLLRFPRNPSGKKINMEEEIVIEWLYTRGTVPMSLLSQD